MRGRANLPTIRISPAGLLRGEVDVVEVEVPAVLAAGLLLDRVVVRAERVRLVPALPPRLRAGPVSLRAHVSQENVDRWVRTARLPARVRLTADGVAIATGIAGVRTGEVLADLEVTGRFLRLAPRRLSMLGVAAPIPRLARGYLPLPPLPRGARLTDVQHGDGDLAVTFTIPELEETLTPELAGRVARLLRLPWPGGR